MSYEEKAAGSSDVYFGIEWNESSSATTFSIAPTIYRWDKASTDNYGSAFSETLSPDPSGNGSWSGLSYPSGSGYRTIDTFGTRTYNRGHSDSTVTYVIYTDSEFGTWNGYWQSIGSLSRTFTITVPRKASYSVTFNANGGSGAPSAQTKWYGETLTLSSTTPTRTGYTFSKWNTKADGTGTNYNSGASYTGNGALTLYAIWTKNSYTVTFNANGGTGAPSAQTKTAGVNLTLTSSKPTRTGYSFSKWNTKADGSGTNYNSGGTYSADANVTLYAQWTKLTYSVSYNANGGSGAPSAQTKTYGVDITLSSTKPTRTGYTFSKWNTKADGTGTNYNPGATYSANAAATLYAKWVAVTYTVSYNANGGTGAPSAQTKTYGVNLTLSSAKPTKTGYTFSAWNTAASGSSGTSYSSGATYSANAAVTLYARWTANTWYVKYNANGGSGSMSNSTHTYDTAKALTANAFTRTYTVTYNHNYTGSTNTTGTATYSFSKWNTNSSGTGTSYNNQASVKNLTSTAGGTVNLYAIWTSASVTLETPVRNGYTFGGWYKEAACTTKVGNAGATYTPTSTLTLYAKWTIKTYSVTYNANGGTGAPASQTKTHGVNLTLSSMAPTRSSCKFIGWSTSSTATTAEYSPGSSYTADSAVTLYAVWAPVASITSLTAVRCDENGDQDDEGTYAGIVAIWSMSPTVNAASTGAAKLYRNGVEITSGKEGTWSGNSGGTATVLVGDSSISQQYTFEFEVTITTGTDTQVVTRSVVLTRSFFTLDFKAGGEAVGILSAAPDSGVAIGSSASNTLDVTGDTSILGRLELIRQNITRGATDALSIGDGTDDVLTVNWSGNVVAGNTVTLGTNTTAEENGIRIKGGGTRNAWLLRNISAANGDGDAVLLGNGGATLIGGGEAHSSLWTELTKTNPAPPEGTLTVGTENLYLGADSNTVFYTNCQTIANRIRIVLSNTGAFYRQHYTLDSSSANNGGISANVAAPGYGLADKNGRWVGYANTWGDTTGHSYYSIRARRYDTIAEDNIDNALTLGIDKDGNRSVAVTASAPWRSALIVPGLGTANEFNGGTQKQKFSGNKNWSNQDTVVDITKSNNGLSSGTRYHEWLSYDKESLIPGGLTNSIASGGNIVTQVRCRNYKSSDGTTVVNNNIVLTAKKDGSVTVEVTSPAAWRTALGLGSLATQSSITSSDISGSLTQNTSGSAAKLTTARSLYVALGTNYDSSSPVTFDGSAAKALPVSGTLTKARGGTQKTNTDVTYYGAKSLISSGGGTNGTITLSETAANYSMLLIQYRDNENHYSSRTIISPNSKQVTLDVCYAANAHAFIKSRTVSISGTSITTVSGTTTDLTVPGTATSTSNSIYITAVWGWK